MELKSFIDYTFETFYKDFTTNKKPVIIFCTSYSYVSDTIRLLNFLKKDNIEIELIVQDNDLIKFFKKYYHNSYKFLWNIKSRPYCYNKIYDLIGIIKEIIHLKSLTNQINFRCDTNVLFFSCDYVRREFYLYNFLKNNGNNFFNIRQGELNLGIRTKSFIDGAKEKLFQFLYGSEISYIKSGFEKYTRIQDSFFDDIKVYQMSDKSVIESFYTNSIEKLDESIKVIYFDTPFFAIQSSDLKPNLFRMLNKYVGSINEIGIKLHPGRSNTNKTVLQYGIEVESFIPAQIIDYSSCKLAIGYGSTTLAKTILDDLPAISLTYLQGLDEETVRREVRFLKLINNDILLPKSFGEFESMVKQILQPVF